MSQYLEKKMDRMMDKILIWGIFILTFLTLTIVGLLCISYKVNEIHSIIVRIEGSSNPSKVIKHD